jgi:hypothetical protein
MIWSIMSINRFTNNDTEAHYDSACLHTYHTQTEPMDDLFRRIYSIVHCYISLIPALLKHCLEYFVFFLLIYSVISYHKCEGFRQS